MSIGSTFSKVLIKGAGAAGLFFVCRDAHVMGKYYADANPKTKISKHTQDLFINNQFLDNPSITDAKMKKRVLDWHLKDGVQEFVYSGTGYLKGFFNMLSDKVVPFALSLGALFGKRLLGKASAIGLGIYAAYKFINQGLMIGRSKNI